MSRQFWREPLPGLSPSLFARYPIPVVVPTRPGRQRRASRNQTQRRCSQRAHAPRRCFVITGWPRASAITNVRTHERVVSNVENKLLGGGGPAQTVEDANHDDRQGGKKRAGARLPFRAPARWTLLRRTADKNREFRPVAGRTHGPACGSSRFGSGADSKESSGFASPPYDGFAFIGRFRTNIVCQGGVPSAP
jgi:hypothetical protein